jgi:hypothetical protein
MPLPSAAQAAPRICLHCDDDFIPARKGWRAVYCSDECRRANNAGATERAKPLTVIPPDPAPPPDPKLRTDPPDPHARLDRSARRDFERLRDLLDQATVPVWRVAGLVVVRRERCERCGTDHDVYGLTPGGTAR